MQSLTQPTLLLKPFAQSGDKNTIPSTNTDASNPQLADLTNGFPPITGETPENGGLPPERRDINGLGYLTTTYDYFYQAGGTFTYNATIATAIGGYPEGARLWYVNSSGVACILRSTIGNNTNNFLTDSSVIGEVGSGKPWVIDRFRGLNTQYDLFDIKWSDYELTDTSWLRSDTFSWNSGVTYANAYQHLVSDISGRPTQTETVGSYTITFYRATDGHKIVLANQEQTVDNIFNESGIAWYYILDTTNTRFKLPRTKYAFNCCRDTVGNNIPAGLPNITGRFAVNGGLPFEGAFETDETNGNALGGAVQDSTRFNASLSNSIYGASNTVQPPATQMYLYFYTGEFSLTAIEETAGLNANLFAGKVDLNFNNMNPSATSKQTIVGWGMPDYNSIVQITTGYVAPSNGVLLFSFPTRSSGYFTVGSYTQSFDYVYSYTQPTWLCLPVKKGQSVTFSGLTINFAPCLGG